MVITKKFTFDAAHRVLGLPKEHKCSRLHGHTYRVEIGIRGSVIDPGTGFLEGFDFADLATAWGEISGELDHRDLNEIVGLGNPTCENVTVWIMRRLQKTPIRKVIDRVRVHESSTTWCEVTRRDLMVLPADR